MFMETRETIGAIVNDKYEKEFHGQGFIYKDFKAFYEKSSDICYCPEDDDFETIDNGYSYNDFLEEAKECFKRNKFKGNPEVLATVIFERCDWAHPCTMIAELECDDEFEEYPETYGIVKK